MAKVAGSTERGFTLLEVLVAASVVAVALLLGGGIHWRVQAVGRGLDAEAELLRNAHAVVESLRAGAHPLVSGPVNTALAWVEPTGELHSMNLVVRASELPGLCQVRVQARSRAKRSGWHDISLDTQIWQQGASCK